MQVANLGSFHYSLQTERSGELSAGSVTAGVRGGNGDGGNSSGFSNDPPASCCPLVTSLAPPAAFSLPGLKNEDEMLVDLLGSSQPN